MRRFTMAALLVGPLVLGALPAFGADEILKLVPDSASAVVLLHRPAAIEAKIQALGRLMQLPTPSPLLLLKLKAGIKEGLDENGTVGIVLLPAEKKPAPQPTILLVPVTNYGAFVRQFKGEDSGAKPTKIQLMHVPLAARNVGGYAALSLTPDTLDCLKPSPAAPPALAPWKEWFSGSDVSGVILSPGIKQISARLQADIAKARSSLPKSNKQAQMAASVFDAYAQMFLAAEKQVSAVGFGVQLDEHNALRVVKRITLAQGTWSDVLAKVHPARENLLQGLPAGPFALACGGSGPEPLAGMQQFAFELMKRLHDLYGLSEDRIAKLVEASSESMEGVNGMSLVVEAGPGGESVFSSIVGLMRVEDSAVFLQRYQKYVQQYNAAMKGAESAVLQPLEVEKATLAGAPALRVSMNAPKAMPGMEKPEYDRAMAAFFGPDKKLRIWLAPAGPRTVVMSYMGKDRVQRVVEDIRQGKRDLTQDAEVVKTAKLLPVDAFAVGYVSLPGMLAFVKQMIPAFAPPGAELPKLLQVPDFPQMPPVGFAFSAAPRELNICVAAPSELFAAMGEYGKAARSGKPSASASPASPPEPATPYLKPGASSYPPPQPKPSSASTEPMTLDIARFYNLKDAESNIIQSFRGGHVIDGMPFCIGGQARLWGQTFNERHPESNLPETFRDIRIGRTFDELHVIHHCLWPDVDSQTVAYISLNYADGTKYLYPIRYGVHVRDWFYLPSYDQDRPSDPNTKICWRHPPVRYKAPVHVFKTRLINPSPEKVVDTIDVISARTLTNYCLVAATVAKRDPSRLGTSPVPAEPPRKFDGRLVIRVVDDASGKPLGDALIEPGMVVQDESVVAEPLLTSSAGASTIRYPVKQTSEIWVGAKKEGYQSESHQWRAGDIPDAFTLRLKRQ